MQIALIDTVLPLIGIEFNILLLIGIGFAVGVLAAFFGFGGGWIVTPTLHILGFPIPFAIGTTLANITAQNGMAVTKHNKMGTVEPVLGAVIGVSMAMGMEVGAQGGMYLESTGMAGNTIRWLYVLFLGGLGVWMQYDYWSSRSKVGQNKGEPDMNVAGGRTQESGSRESWHELPPFVTLKTSGGQISLWKLLLVGLVIGCLAGIMGCGGGFLLVPAFIYVIGIPTVVAVGTSLVSILLAGAYGTFTYALKGRVELIAALWMVLGAAVGVHGSAVCKGL